MALAEYIQDVFMTDRFRVYTNDDVCGVELGGALKNIIALGAGISMESASETTQKRL